MISKRFIYFSGVYNIFVDSGDGPKNVGKYDGSGSFGELALLYNMPRAASIQVFHIFITFLLLKPLRL